MAIHESVDLTTRAKRAKAAACWSAAAGKAPTASGMLPRQGIDAITLGDRGGKPPPKRLLPPVEK